jgi:toxin ParE1/3/4
MKRRLVLREAALSEVDESVRWYEASRTGLGAEFVAEVQRVFDAIVSQPDRFPIIVADVREAPLDRFPFCVYYRDRSSRIVVIAVFHNARDPAAWQSRL